MLTQHHLTTGVVTSLQCDYAANGSLQSNNLNGTAQRQTNAVTFNMPQFDQEQQRRVNKSDELQSSASKQAFSPRLFFTARAVLYSPKRILTVLLFDC